VKYYELLKNIEEKIEYYYIYLAKLEINGNLDSLEYNEYFQLIIDLTNKESKLIDSLDTEDIKSIIKKLKKEYHNENSHSTLGLGFTVNAYYGRLMNLLNSLMGDDILDYACTLEYDKNQIMLSILNFMISNPYYNDIKRDLIFYKYNLIYMNMKSEYDFFITKDIETIELEANNYRTMDLPGYKYVDKAILVLESIDDLSDIVEIEEDFRNNEQQYTNLTIKILNVLANFTLLEEDLLPIVLYDLNAILEAENVYGSIKEYIHELLNILEGLKNKISWAR
jgi:hypothetical protein